MNQQKAQTAADTTPASATFADEAFRYLPGATRIVDGRVYRFWYRFERNSPCMRLAGTMLAPLQAAQADIVEGFF